jgi:hypothetical protein
VDYSKLKSTVESEFKSGFSHTAAWAKSHPKRAIGSVVGIVISAYLVAGYIDYRDRTAGAGTSVAAAQPSPTHLPATTAPTLPPAFAAGPAPARVAPAMPALAVASIGTAPLVPAAPPVATQPPAGLVAGHVLETIAQRDQFGQFSVVSTSVDDAPSTSLHSIAAPADSPAWHEALTGWFRLDTPAAIAVLRIGAGAAANAGVSASIDGTSLGSGLRYGPASETASIALAPGWHRFQIDAEGQSSTYAPPATAIELQIGNGATSPAPVVPYAVAPQPKAADHVTSEVPVTSASPAPTQTAAKATPAGTTPFPAKASIADATTAGATKEH